MKVQTRQPEQTIPLVRDIMQRGVITVASDMSVPGLANLLSVKMISGAPVVDPSGEVVGVVSLADIAAHAANLSTPRRGLGYYGVTEWDDEDLAEGFHLEDLSDGTTVADIMTPMVHLVRDTDGISSLVKLLLASRIHRALVTDGKAVVGIVTTTDVLRAVPQLLAR